MTAIQLQGYHRNHHLQTVGGIWNDLQNVNAKKLHLITGHIGLDRRRPSTTAAIFLISFRSYQENQGGLPYRLTASSVASATFFAAGTETSLRQ